MDTIYSIAKLKNEDNPESFRNKYSLEVEN